jgi:hypothetical protein
LITIIGVDDRESYEGEGGDDAGAEGAGAEEDEGAESAGSLFWPPMPNV